MIGPARSLLVLLLSLLPCCSGGERGGERAVATLERMAFVPPGASRIPGVVGVCASAESLLVDRFEVTRHDWMEWLETGAADAAEFQWVPGPGTWPATMMTLEEARAFAAWRGTRLLTAREWLRVASGTRAQLYPWEPVAFTSVANTLDLGIHRPSPVGTFERGKTPFGTYDMVGNVWEWVDGRVPYLDDPDNATHAWAMGGSYLSRQRSLFGRDAKRIMRLLQTDLDPDHRGGDIGLRCAVGASAYLWDNAARWGDHPDVLARLRAVGNAWGPAAAPVLEELVQRPGAPIGLTALLSGAR